MLRSAWIPLASSLLLGACTVTVSGCPPLTTYSAEFQKKAAAQLRALPSTSPVAILVTDYGKFRDACRVK